MVCIQKRPFQGGRMPSKLGVRACTLPALLLLLCSGGSCSRDVVYTGKCDGAGLDGTALALTPELYTHGYSAYKDAVCVPANAFCRTCADSPGLTFQGDVILKNMSQLVYVGIDAFYKFQGKLTISGSFPKWKEVGRRAFGEAGTADSLVALDDAPMLGAVDDFAFRHFGGTQILSAATNAVTTTGKTMPTDYPPAPGSGGKECTFNAECGLPAANCNSLRKDCTSLSGACLTGRASTAICVCATNYYGCSNCAAKSSPVPSKTDPSGYKEIDECSVARGDGKCNSDRECGGTGGLCIAGRCICPDSWLCSDCSISLTDLLYGLECGVAQTGGGSCDTSNDCGDGVCTKPGGRPPYCVCNPLYSCPRCNHRVQDLVSGKVKCGDPPPPPPSPPSPAAGKYVCTEGACTPSSSGKGVTKEQCAEVCGTPPPPPPSPPPTLYVCVDNNCVVAEAGQKGLPENECKALCSSSPTLYVCKESKCVESPLSGKGLPLSECKEVCSPLIAIV